MAQRLKGVEISDFQDHTCCDVGVGVDDDDHDHHRKCNLPEFSDFKDLGISGTCPVRRTEVCAPTESLRV